jgi:hypothetical protein
MPGSIEGFPSGSNSRVCRRAVIIRTATGAHMAKKLNEDKPWSEMDVSDLKNHFAGGAPIAEIADLLMRRDDEILLKLEELGLTPTE